MSISRFTVLLTLAIGLSACSTLNQVSGAAFMEQSKHINALESAQSTTYIGATQSRVYLERWTASSLNAQGTTTVIWTPLSELPPSIANKIKEGVNPWEKHDGQLVTNALSGKWVPESVSCDSPLSVYVTSTAITCKNESEKSSLNKLSNNMFLKFNKLNIK